MAPGIYFRIVLLTMRRNLVTFTFFNAGILILTPESAYIIIFIVKNILTLKLNLGLIQELNFLNLDQK